MARPTPAVLYKTTCRVLREVHRAIELQLLHRPDLTLGYLPAPEKEASNQPLKLDQLAEDTCIEKLLEKFGEHVISFGEESLKSPEASSVEEQSALVAQMDMIDGTDLLLRGFGNWVSAITFFSPAEKRIVLSAVMDPEGTMYFAQDGENTSFYQRLPKLGQHLPRGAVASAMSQPAALHISKAHGTLNEARIAFYRGRASGPRITSLRNASICCNSQKPSALDRFLRQTGFHKWNEELHREGSQDAQEKPGPVAAFRYYNMSGIPMMAKLAVGAVDGIVQLGKQKPHDVVTGAYIALKAGATMLTLGGRQLAEEDLANALFHPLDRFEPYVLASCPELARELVDAFTIKSRVGYMVPGRAASAPGSDVATS